MRKQGNGIAFVDSTPLRVCTNKRINQHKTFKLEAGRSQVINRVVLWV
jgi:hypothetical protein